MFETPITKTYDNIQADDDLLFSTVDSESLTHLHPSPVRIFRLWQAVLDNVNPLTKIFHAPTIQQLILKASANLEKVSRGVEALMLSIYSCAAYSLGKQECKSMFGRDKSVLLKQYQAGSRQALLRAEFLRSSDMTVLQALVLCLVSNPISLSTMRRK
jgi:hypothetical protein